ncbi:MAG: hypothetical protein ACTHJ0_02610, partial [Flavipsychrobacter sp.]
RTQYNYKIVNLIMPLSEFWTKALSYRLFRTIYFPIIGLFIMGMIACIIVFKIPVEFLGIKFNIKELDKSSISQGDNSRIYNGPVTQYYNSPNEELNSSIHIKKKKNGNISDKKSSDSVSSQNLVTNPTFNAPAQIGNNNVQTIIYK